MFVVKKLVENGSRGGPHAIWAFGEIQLSLYLREDERNIDGHQK